MAEERIAAEVVPADPTDPAGAGRVARALAQRGFRVLHVGWSISVDAPREAWEATFGVDFPPLTPTVQPGIDGAVSAPRAGAASVRVPPELQDLVADVAFAEPPELF